MKASIVGDLRFVDGNPVVPIVIGEGPSAPKIEMPVASEDMPARGWESVIQSQKPYKLNTFSGSHGMLWLCGRKIVQLVDADHLSDKEQTLEVAHAVLRHEKRYKLLRRQVEAYDRIERADTARRERIPDDIRMFVWQRDEGKCVKCGSNERLEFDHIIPLVKGGSTTERNIQLLCESCNRAKGAQI
jgi:5-methylcytosine-specific restriction endonuclease McrA